MSHVTPTRRSAQSSSTPTKPTLDQAQVAYDQSVQQLKLGAVSGYNGGSRSSGASGGRKERASSTLRTSNRLAFYRSARRSSGVIQSVTLRRPTTRCARSSPAMRSTAGQAIFTIAGGHDYIVRAQVDEQDIINVRLGQAGERERRRFSRQDHSRARRAHRTDRDKIDRCLEHREASAHDDRSSTRTRRFSATE